MHVRAKGAQGGADPCGIIMLVTPFGSFDSVLDGETRVDI